MVTLPSKVVSSRARTAWPVKSACMCLVVNWKELNLAQIVRPDKGCPEENISFAPLFGEKLARLLLVFKTVIESHDVTENDINNNDKIFIDRFFDELQF